MHPLRTRPPGRVDQLIDGDIALCRRRRPDQDRLIAYSRVERTGVGLRIYRDRAHAEPCRRTRNTNRDLATIGDQDRREHGYAISSGRRRIYVAGRFPRGAVENKPRSPGGAGTKPGGSLAALMGRARTFAALQPGYAF